MSTAKITFDAAIICDAIRQEASGKMILIGAFASDLSVPKFPLTILMAVYAEGVVHQAGNISTTARVIDVDGGALSDIYSGMFDFVTGRFSHTLQFSFVVQRETTISVIVNDGEKDHILLKRDINLVPFDPNLAFTALHGRPAA